MERSGACLRVLLSSCAQLCLLQLFPTDDENLNTVGRKLNSSHSSSSCLG